MDDLWQEALGEIGKRLGKQNFETWIKPIHFDSRTKNEVRLAVPNKFFRDWLTEHFLRQIEDVLSSLAHQEVKVCLNVNQYLQTKNTGEKTERKEEREREKPQRVNNLIPRYTFENFVVGASNQFAHAASVAVASQPGENYNPLFIYGGVGLGKTHLVNATGHEPLVKQARSSIFYLSSESFTNQLIAHLRSDRMDDFKNKFRQADVLILDDVQFLSGRERTQEEFFHTFNSLHSDRHQIVLTCDKVPRDIAGLEERLRNRFESGLIADSGAPDLETRVAIMQKKAVI